MLVQTPSAWSVKPSNESRLTWRAGQNSVFLACRQPRPDVKAAERFAVSGILPGLASGCPTPCRQSLRSVVEPARDFPEFLRFILLPGASVSRLPRVRICHSNTKPRRGLICRNDTISLPVFDLQCQKPIREKWHGRCNFWFTWPAHAATQEKAGSDSSCVVIAGWASAFGYLASRKA